MIGEGAHAGHKLIKPAEYRSKLKRGTLPLTVLTNVKPCCYQDQRELSNFMMMIREEHL